MPTSKRKPSFGNLPIPLSSFVGREREIREIQELLLSNRLVTLTGPGGCGKTRLAMKVARELSGEFERDIWLVELASISDPALVPQTVAAVLSVHEQSGRAMIDVLVDYLLSRHLLLVIDNCEHLITACAQFTETLLQKCPNLKILVTSREALGITGEIVWTVPPLSLPDSKPWTNPASTADAVRSYEESESIQLFVVRAADSSPDFRLTTDNGGWVAEICRRLDGMPLAIELAAARVRSLSVQEIAQRLDDRFHLLTGGSRNALPRQQTLTATLDWSYNLLSEAEQKVLQSLSVFAGGATLDAIESVYVGEEVGASEALDLLSRLVDKSLVMVDKREVGETRYRLLETIRQYVLEKLAESGALDETKNRHLDYFIQWAESAERRLDGSKQLLWLDRLETEHDNLRAALEYAALPEVPAEAGLRLTAAVGNFWRLHGYHGEGRMRLEVALSHHGAEAPTLTRAHALRRAYVLAFFQSDYPAARALAEESLDISRRHGSAGKLEVAHALELLAETLAETGDHTAASRLYEEALPIYRELGYLSGVADTLKMLGWSAMRTGDYALAESRLEEALVVCRRTGELRHIASALAGLGELAIRQGKYERADDLLKESLILSQDLGEKWGIPIALGSLGWLTLRQGDMKRMRELLRESLSIRAEAGDKGGIAWCLEKLAEAASLEGEPQKSVKAFGAASALRAPIGSVIDPADQADYDRIISDLQSALGPDAFAALWAEGASMPLDEVIAYALSESESSIAESSRAEKEKFGGLTTREREVAILIAKGKSNREIAEAMVVGVRTVETYVTRILNKLGFDSRVQIATWAIEKGLNKKESE